MSATSRHTIQRHRRLKGLMANWVRAHHAATRASKLPQWRHLRRLNRALQPNWRAGA